MKAPRLVPVNTSLPPKVDGPARCVLIVRMKEILWTSSVHIDQYVLRVAWWGEDGVGALFRPYEPRSALPEREQGVRSTARYMVRAGPKHFAAYLQGSSSLAILLSSSSHLPLLFPYLTSSHLPLLFSLFI